MLNINISMGHGLFGGQEDKRGYMKLNTQHLGKHLFVVLQS